MNKRFVFAALAASLLGMTACSKPPQSDIGLVDVARLTSNWPKFLNYQNQLNADMAAIKHSNAPEGQKQREMQGAAVPLSHQPDRADERRARRGASKSRATSTCACVFTRQFVGYGGVDITPDVEKILKIVEKATPSP